jgi:hypothetical protein
MSEKIDKEAVAKLIDEAAEQHSKTCPVGGVLRGLAARVREEQSGPAQVATPAYRDGWDATFNGKTIFGKKIQPGAA